MSRIKHSQLFFKCCHKIDKNVRGYMFQGKYIECVSAHCWKLLDTYLRDKSKDNLYRLIEIFADIKRKNRDKWSYFMAPMKMPKVPYRSTYSFDFYETEPSEPYILYKLNDTVIYEKWSKI